MFTFTKKRAAITALGGVMLLATVGGASALASQSAAATPAGTTAVLIAVPHCLTHDLVAGLHGSQIGSGNRGYILTLTNAGSQSCSLLGYPGLGLQNANHQVLASHTFWGSTYFARDPGRSLIVLSPGETASTDFAYGSDGVPAHSVTATYLEVTPPNAFRYITLRLPGAPVLIYHGNLYVTASARHTSY